MSIAEFFAILGIFVIVWWIGRKVAQALDRYELMKGQRRNDGRGPRDGRGERRNMGMPGFPVHPRPNSSR